MLKALTICALIVTGRGSLAATLRRGAPPTPPIKNASVRFPDLLSWQADAVHLARRAFDVYVLRHET
ncbi:MAG TPA: hypothetical protein VGS41_12820, partial [Chthonomonadales bacterium]|nr:hypothetical protein [Chthonomonadales bacterium]